jgi:predicted metal-dependent hydrolase
MDASNASESFSAVPEGVPMQRRAAPAFGFGPETPRFWFEGNPFKTRFFDAMSLIFPPGEKFFINSVRAYRSEIRDPQLSRQVDDFIYQEAQHSMVHRSFNEHMERQGVPAIEMQNGFEHMLSSMQKMFPKRVNLLRTAALEHFTATLGICFYTALEQFRGMDPGVRAAYAWHLVEEVEHRSVCYNVMSKTVGVTYLERIATMLVTSVMFPYRILKATNDLLVHDGFSGGERLRLFNDGMRWLFGRKGIAWGSFGEYCAYFKIGFHPDKTSVPPGILSWRSEYDDHGSAFEASQALFGEKEPALSSIAA